MLKAAQDMSATVTLCKSLSRRALLRFGALAGISTISAPAAAAIQSPSRIEPSALGKELLAAYVERRQVWVDAEADPESDLGEPPYVQRIEAAEHRIVDISNAICERPVATLQDAIDRALVATDDVHFSTVGEMQTHDGEAWGIERLLTDVLAVAGLDPAVFNNT